MVNYLTNDLIIHIIFFQLAVLVIILTNIIITRRARKHPDPKAFPHVSILVPARNEEKNIARCVQSLLNQNYPSFEILVLDDQSIDHTRLILEEITKSHLELKILDGQPAPGNQIGKNWACSQLSKVANADFLFFTDADTIHKPDTLKEAIITLFGEEADLISGFPQQILGSWGEKLLVPFFSWAILAFIPLGLAYKLRSPILSSAVGQMMLFRREAYQAIGGHAGTGSSIVDDLALVRKIKETGFRWRVVYISDLVSCRMYQNSQEAFYGFSKNLFAAFDFRLLPFTFAFLWLAVMFLLPLVVFCLLIIGLTPQAQLNSLISCISLSILLWLIPFQFLGISRILSLLYPIVILANLATAILSVWRSLTGKLTWKDRDMPLIKWKLF